MNLNVNLGKQNNGEDFELDFAKQNLNLVLLLGATGTGKSVFHNTLYRNLAAQNSNTELGFVFLDNTRVDFVAWKTKYVLKLAVDHNEGLKTMEEFAELAAARNRGEADNSQAIFMHIEECDLMAVDSKRFEAAWLKLWENKTKSNIYTVFSTSRPSAEVLTPAILGHVDLKVIFGMASERDSNFVLGSDVASKFDKPGQRLLVYHDNQVLCQPFPEEQAPAMANFNMVD
jgi:DNA segregation ATPase FtsK/SpoIIIE-like protein